MSKATVTRRAALKAVILAAPAAAVPMVAQAIDPRQQGSLRVDGTDLVTEFPDGRVWRHPIATLRDIRVSREGPKGEWTIVTVHDWGVS